MGRYIARMYQYILFVKINSRKLNTVCVDASRYVSIHTICQNEFQEANHSSVRTSVEFTTSVMLLVRASVRFTTSVTLQVRTSDKDHSIRTSVRPTYQNI